MQIKEEFKERGLHNLPGNYTIAAGYKLSIDSNQEVYWSRQVWCKLNIPKHAFIWWLVMWNRLRTKDRLLTHMNISDGLCLFCMDKKETTKHLYFECSFSAKCLVEIKKWLHCDSKGTDVSELVRWLQRVKCSKGRREI